MVKHDMTTKDKKNVPMKLKQDFFSCCGKKVCTDLSNASHNDSELEKPLKFANTCHKKVLSHDLSEGDQLLKRGFVKLEQ